jgi:hypothetical protein
MENSDYLSNLLQQNMMDHWIFKNYQQAKAENNYLSSHLKYYKTKNPPDNQMHSL